MLSIMTKKLFIAGFTAFFAASCASIEVPDRPVKSANVVTVQTLPQQFFNGAGESLPMASHWWSGFNDPILSKLIETALAENRELNVAQSNIQIAQASLIRQQLETSYRTGSNAGINIGRSPTPLENGRATALDINRADAQYRTTLAQLPSFQAVIDGALSRLAVLTGGSASEPVSEITDLRATARPIPSVSADIAMGTPADLIRRRPDIRAAETEIARRLALGEIDRARLFPTITLGLDLSALFGGGNRLDQLSSFGFGLGPAISWEGPDLRRVRADIKITDAETERAYQVYEQTVLQALSDVEIALTELVNERQRLSNLERAVVSARNAAEIAQLRFDEGIDDFLDVLDAQRTLLEAEDRLAQNELQTTRLAILTYRELGGT